MKCENCGEWMKFVGLVPRLGRRSLGKQREKYVCLQCGKTAYKQIKKIVMV